MGEPGLWFKNPSLGRNKKALIAMVQAAETLRMEILEHV